MTSLIILAAGESSRLGFPKQNLLFKNQTLLQLAVEVGLESECDHVIVVLGGNAHLIKPIPGVATLYNGDWKEGMASSIRTGIAEIINAPLVDSAIIILCDQPFVNADLLNALISKQIETGKSIVACTYNGTIGVPVLFHRSIFQELLSLQGQEGAKKILKNHIDHTAVIPFEEGEIDIDTPEDYEKLIVSKSFKAG